MKNQTLIKTGVAGAAIAAICCATPILVIVLATIGLSTLVEKADYILIPLLVGSLVLLAVGLYRRRMVQACCDTNQNKKIVP